MIPKVTAEAGKVLMDAEGLVTTMSVDETAGLIRALQDAMRHAQRQSREEAFTHKRRWVTDGR